MFYDIFDPIQYLEQSMKMYNNFEESNHQRNLKKDKNIEKYLLQNGTNLILPVLYPLYFWVKKITCVGGSLDTSLEWWDWEDYGKNNDFWWFWDFWGFCLPDTAGGQSKSFR